MLDDSIAVGSPTLLETYLVLGGRGAAPSDARAFCAWVAALPGAEIVAFTSEHFRWGQLAFDRFGKGRGSGAGLNYGDCMSYAVARERAAPLLFTGGDFRRTDVAVHPASPG